MTFSSDRKPKKFTPKEAKLKAAHYCAYQERSQKEVRNKLYEYGLYRDEVEEIISDLVTEGFVNEERFAVSYVGGKFRIKKWGRVKILQGLKQHDISPYCIKKGLEEIDEGEYLSLIESLIQKKLESLNTSDMYKARQKTASFLVQRGFEPQIIWEILKGDL